MHCVYILRRGSDNVVVIVVPAAVVAVVVHKEGERGKTDLKRSCVSLGGCFRSGVLVC